MIYHIWSLHLLELIEAIITILSCYFFFPSSLDTLSLNACPQRYIPPLSTKTSLRPPNLEPKLSFVASKSVGLGQYGRAVAYIVQQGHPRLRRHRCLIHSGRGVRGKVLGSRAQHNINETRIETTW